MDKRNWESFAKWGKENKELKNLWMKKIWCPCQPHPGLNPPPPSRSKCQFIFRRYSNRGQLCKSESTNVNLKLVFVLRSVRERTVTYEKISITNVKTTWFLTVELSSDLKFVNSFSPSTKIILRIKTEKYVLVLKFKLTSDLWENGKGWEKNVKIQICREFDSWSWFLH